MAVKGLGFCHSDGERTMVPHTESEAWATPGASVHGNRRCGAARELEVGCSFSDRVSRARGGSRGGRRTCGPFLATCRLNRPFLFGD